MVSSFVRVAASTAVVAGLAACAGPSMFYPSAQSHFDFPNSNVIPVGPAKGVASRSYIMPFQVPSFNDPYMLKEAQAQAIKSRGGDLLIDQSISMKSMMVPLPFIQIVTVDMEVEGTVAKMEIGKKSLK